MRHPPRSRRRARNRAPPPAPARRTAALPRSGAARRARAAAPGRGCRATGRGTRPRRECGAPRGSSRAWSAPAPSGAARPRARHLRPSRCSQLSSTSSSVRGARNVDERVDDVLPRQRPHVERRGDGVGHEPGIGQRGERDERGAVRRTTPRRARASSSASRVLPAPPVPESVSRRVRPSSARSSASSRSRPTNELASVGSPRGPSAGAERGELLGELRSQLGELVAPARRPVVVAVLRAAARRRRSRARRDRRPASRLRRASAAASLEPVDVDVRDEEEHLVAHVDRVRRRARGGRRAPPGGGCSPPPPARDRARGRPSPARDAAGGRARARAASRARAPSSAATPLGHRLAVDRDRKATQERDGDRATRRRMPYARNTSESCTPWRAAYDLVMCDAEPAA